MIDKIFGFWLIMAVGWIGILFINPILFIACVLYLLILNKE